MLQFCVSVDLFNVQEQFKFRIKAAKLRRSRKKIAKMEIFLERIFLLYVQNNNKGVLECH